MTASERKPNSSEMTEAKSLLGEEARTEEMGAETID